MSKCINLPGQFLLFTNQKHGKCAVWMHMNLPSLEKDKKRVMIDRKMENKILLKESQWFQSKNCNHLYKQILHLYHDGKKKICNGTKRKKSWQFASVP